MIWEKKGLLFDPTDQKLSNEIVEFAQSPQTLVFDDFIRIYFSTRSRDEKGQYLSKIAFVDTDLNLEKIINISTNEVIQLGNLGTFDEHGIFPINPFKDEDGKIYAITCGWNRRVSVPVETAIGLVVSKDCGKTFERIFDGPIVSSDVYEPVLVGDGFVQKYNGLYYMWYIYGTKWMDATANEPVARVYKIGYATSKDLIHWDKANQAIISDVLNDEECQALPTVIEKNGKYHMYFCFREATDFRKNRNRGYRLGYAYSSDLINWTRDDENCGMQLQNNGDWDGEMMCYPHIFKVKNEVYLLYNGNEFGKFGFGVAKLKSV